MLSPLRRWVYRAVMLCAFAFVVMTLLGHSPLQQPLKAVGIQPETAIARGVEQQNVVVAGDRDRSVSRALDVMNQSPSQTRWSFGTANESNVQVRTTVARDLGSGRTDETEVVGLTYRYHGRATVRLADGLGRDRWMIALHEFAHAVGISHNDIPCSVMNPVIDACTSTFIDGVAKIAQEFNTPSLLQCVWNSVEARQWQRLHGARLNPTDCRNIDTFRRRLIEIYTTD